MIECPFGHGDPGRGAGRRPLQDLIKVCMHMHDCMQYVLISRYMPGGPTHGATLTFPSWLAEVWANVRRAYPSIHDV